MDVFEAIESRRSIRRFKRDPVPAELLDRVLDAARLSPSSSNTQSWRFKVVTDDTIKKEIRASAHGQRFIEQAPVVIACCLDAEAFKERGRQTLRLVMSGARFSLEMMLRAVRGGKDKGFDPERVVINGTINVSIAVEHMVLAARALGLGTCWVRAFDAEAVARTLDLPDGLVLVCLLPLGYPDESPRPRPRKDLEDILIED